MLRSASLALIMVIGSFCAFWLVPKTQSAAQAVNLEALVPTKFGNWHALPDVRLVTAQDPGSLEQELYSQVVTRAYADNNNHVVMLLLAYGPSQTDRLQLHRPEICYVANGFRVGRISKALIDVTGAQRLPVKRLVATRESRVEYITYWMRIGDRIANNVFSRQLIKLEYGLGGVVPDGLLVRTSVIGSSSDAYQIQDEFLSSLAKYASPLLRYEIFGRPPR